MKKLIYTLIFCLLFNSIDAQEVIIIDTSESVFDKQALVILNGFGDSKKIEKYSKSFFKKKDMTYLFRNMLKKTQLI
jgi:hypothetical protein